MSDTSDIAMDIFDELGIETYSEQEQETYIEGIEKHIDRACQPLREQLKAQQDSDWTGTLIDALNSLARENRKYFEEVTSGRDAAVLVRLIHGEFNSLQQRVKELELLTADRMEWQEVALTNRAKLDKLEKERDQLKAQVDRLKAALLEEKHLTNNLVNSLQSERYAAAELPQLREAMKELLASAAPNPTEHPKMFAAWEKGQQALSTTAGNDLLAELAQLREQLASKQKQLEYLCKDTTEDDTAIRELCKPFLPEPTQADAIKGEHDGYGVIPLVDVVREALAQLRAQVAFLVSVVSVDEWIMDNEVTQEMFCEKCGAWQADGHKDTCFFKQLPTAGADLLAQLAQLRADKDRLDWLDSLCLGKHKPSIRHAFNNKPPLYCFDFGERYRPEVNGDTLRQAIDAARAQQTTEGEKIS